MKNLFLICILIATQSACNTPNSIQESSQSGTSASSAQQNFATGTKGVKILLNTNTLAGSFTLPGVLTASTPIPSTYPGGTTTGSVLYNPGISAKTFYALDGVTQITQPSWLTDFQVGINSLTASSTCATFGGSSSLDVQNTFRVSEVDCGASSNNGTGSSLDQVFIRAILNRNNAYVLQKIYSCKLNIKHQAYA